MRKMRKSFLTIAWAATLGLLSLSAFAATLEDTDINQPAMQFDCKALNMITHKGDQNPVGYNEFAERVSSFSEKTALKHFIAKWYKRTPESNTFVGVGTSAPAFLDRGLSQPYDLPYATKSGTRKEKAWILKEVPAKGLRGFLGKKERIEVEQEIDVQAYLLNTYETYLQKAECLPTVGK